MRTQEFWRVAIDQTKGFNVALRSDLRFVEPAPGVFYHTAECIPYCINFKNELLAYSCGIDLAEAANAPFHYRYLRENTKVVTLIPFEVGLERDCRIAVDPIFIFSIGRCGSTLVTKFVRRIGLVCISESDIFIQALIHHRIKPDLAPSQVQVAELALRCATYDLLRACANGSSRPVVLKMRSQANLSPRSVLSGCNATPRTIFLMRRFEPWAISRWRAFGFSTATNIKHYLDGLHALKWLKDNTDVLLVDYDEIATADLSAYSRLSAFLGMKDTPVANHVADILSIDAQSGTTLAQERLHAKPDRSLLREVQSAWTEAKPAELLTQLGIADRC